MKKGKLNTLIEQQGALLQQNPYEFWINQEYPIIKEEDVAGETAIIEIELLELTDSYIQLGLSGGDGGFSSYLNIGQTFVIYK